ncbi:MAG: magnesium transporter [Oscillospiraceae bacterium]|nr:magnesium transporter [Oscillospiraceae bacterium]
MPVDFDISKYDNTTLKQMLSETNSADIAEWINDLEEKQAAIKLFRLLPKDEAADVFADLSRDMQESIIAAIQDYEISSIIDELFLDDAVDFIEEMPAGVVKRVLSNLPREKRDMINNFLKYPEGSAGSIMTIEYVDLKAEQTVAEAFNRIRRDGVDKETIYTCYVTDSARHLLGVVSVRTLLLSSPDDKIEDIMTREVISANTSDDKENVTNEFSKYGFLAMPVVDNENRLVGIVTFDDILEVQEEEATEDFEIMAAMSPSDEPYLKTKISRLALNRIPWLMLLMITAIISGHIIERFEHALTVMPILITFIPMLMDTAGNSGAQSATLIIRGIALEEITSADTWIVWFREVRVATLCGGALAAVNFVRILLFNRWEFLLAFSVSLALFCTVVIAKSVGCLLPQLAKLLKFDPAVMAAPAITTIVDAAGLLVYFGICKFAFGI